MKKHVVILGMLVASGCGDSEQEPVQVDASSLVGALVNAHCERVFSCCSEDDRNAVFVAEQISSEEECRTALTQQLSAFYQPSVERAVAADRVVLNQNSSDCEAKLKAVSCADFKPGEPTEVADICGATLEPLLENSGFCQHDFECKSSFCSIATDEETGSCADAPEASQPCANLRCGTDAYCDRMTETCTAKIEDDGACTQNEQCQSGRCEIENAQGVCVAVPNICQG